MNASRVTSKTKSRIDNAVAKLMKSSDISKITVSAVLEEADVSRSTFYRYYTDIYDVYETAVATFIDKCTNLFFDIMLTDALSAEDISSSVTTEYFWPGVFAFNEIDSAVFEYLLKNEPTRYINLLKESLQEHIADSPAYRDTDLSLDFIVSFFMESIYTICLHSLSVGKAFNPKHLELAAGIIKKII